GPKRPPFSQKFLYGEPGGGAGSGKSDKRIGLAGSAMSTTEAWLSGSWQSSWIASEFTMAIFRDGKGNALWAPMKPRNGGVKGSWPTSLGCETSLMSRMTRPASP